MHTHIHSFKPCKISPWPNNLYMLFTAGRKISFMLKSPTRAAIKVCKNAPAMHQLPQHAKFPSPTTHFSFHSCENTFCQISIHFCCWVVSCFPGVLNDLFMISRSFVLNVLIASIVFQSETANLALLPSNMKTPAYIYDVISINSLYLEVRCLHHSEHLRTEEQWRTLPQQLSHEHCRTSKAVSITRLVFREYTYCLACIMW